MLFFEKNAAQCFRKGCRDIRENISGFFEKFSVFFEALKIKGDYLVYILNLFRIFASDKNNAK